jgi:hypothetical protein
LTLKDDPPACIKAPLPPSRAGLPGQRAPAGARRIAYSEPEVIRSVPTAMPLGTEGFRLADDVILLLVHDGSGRITDLSGQVAAVTGTHHVD